MAHKPPAKAYGIDIFRNLWEYATSGSIIAAKTHSHANPKHPYSPAFRAIRMIFLVVLLILVVIIVSIDHPLAFAMPTGIFVLALFWEGDPLFWTDLCEGVHTLVISVVDRAVAIAMLATLAFDLGSAHGAKSAVVACTHLAHSL